ncbi:unnamed protein product [Cuscuta campestris]|uniref:Uncharacterized protein n=1 Tax=Cuscuta campestris TaxID=132261 RepID=A0A484LTV8_9ASTE|nr:unnamed protein product [Cuscuta campestris]
MEFAISYIYSVTKEGRGEMALTMEGRGEMASHLENPKNPPKLNPNWVELCQEADLKLENRESKSDA